MRNGTIGGSGGDYGLAIASDSQGSLYVTGGTDSPNFPVTSAFQSTIGGSSDAFVAKLNSNGIGLAYSR